MRFYKLVACTFLFGISGIGASGVPKGSAASAVPGEFNRLRQKWEKASKTTAGGAVEGERPVALTDIKPGPVKSRQDALIAQPQVRRADASFRGITAGIADKALEYDTQLAKRKSLVHSAPTFVTANGKNYLEEDYLTALQLAEATGDSVESILAQMHA